MSYQITIPAGTVFIVRDDLEQHEDQLIVLDHDVKADELEDHIYDELDHINSPLVKARPCGMTQAKEAREIADSMDF